MVVFVDQNPNAHDAHPTTSRWRRPTRVTLSLFGFVSAMTLGAWMSDAVVSS